MTAGKIRVLYVDDEPTLLDLTKQFLERSGDFTVTTAVSASEAIRILGQERFDAIVSDYQMPEMDGIEFLKHLKVEGDTTPFIIFTGKGREEVVIEALNAGADGYHQKGGEPKSQFSELSHKILQVVQHRIDENALQAQTNLLTSMINSSSEFITFALDREYRYLAFNEKHRNEMQKVWKTDIQAGMSILDCMTDPVLCRAVQGSIDRALRGEVFTEVQHQPDPDIWYEFNWNPIRENTGNIMGVIVFIRNITDRKQVEEVLRKSQIQLAEAMDLTNLVNWEFDVASGIFTFNDRFYTLYGTTAEREGGYQMPAEVYARKFVHPDEVSVVADEVQKAITATDPNYTRQIEHRIIRRDGEIRHIIVRYGITKDAEGRTIKTHGANQDITDRKRIEQALRESEEQFRNISELIPDFAYSCRKAPSGGFAIDWMTGAVEPFTGYTADEIKEMTCWKFLVIEEDIPIFEKNVTGLLPGESVRCELRIRRKDGGIIWLASYAKCVIDLKEPGYQRLYGGCRNITVRKQAEEALRISHEKYTKAFLAVPDAITISELDSGRFIEVNDAATRIFGYSRDELIGKSTLELGIWRNKEDRDRLIDQVRKHGKVSQFEVLNWRKSGELYNALVNADTISIGNVSYLLAIIHDITERKRTDEALRESEAKSRSLLECVPELILVHRNGIILYTNPAAVKTLGYQPHEALNRQVTDFIAPEFHERVAAAVRRRMSGEPVEPYEIDVMTRDGSRRRMNINGSMIEFDGAPASLIILVDITKRKKAEEALKQKEAELYNILQGSPIPNFVIDRDHRVMSWNKALEETTGIKAADIIGTTRHWQAFYNKERSCLADLLVDEKTETIQELYAGKIDTVRLAGGVYEGTDFFPNLGNEGKWLHFSASIIRDVGGDVIGAVETLQDITEQKRAEQEIRTLQQFHQSIIDNANVWIGVLDPKGTILVWNTTAEQISGYPARDVIGTNTVWKQIYPDPMYRKQVMENILDVIKKNTYVENFETRIRTKNGDEKIIWWNTQPLRDASGKPVQFIAIGRDNTERRRSEERLRALRQFEESVIKNANIWISVLDEKGIVSIWNRAAEEISGYKADEVIGKNTIWSRMYPDKEYRRTVTATIKEIIRANKYLENFETRIRTKDGQERIIWWNTRVLQDIPGIDETFIAIGKDVTEQKTLNDALRQANKQLNLLSSITRHDILNQLMALKGYLELSHDVIETLREFIKKEQQAANTIDEQITFTRDYQELGVAAPEWQNVNANIEKALLGLPMRDVRADVDCPDLEIFSDPLFDKVFYNLIDNALRYGGVEMKTIRVSSQESDRGLTIVCEDDGVGISAESKKRLFTRGFGKHTGLGLFLSREILSITGITITENGKPGKGARFEITVPEGMWRVVEADKTGN